MAYYTDWFLPSKDELNQMYVNLHLHGVGGFANNYYNCSTEGNASNIWLQYFSTGGQGVNIKSTLSYVRACRVFTSITPSYSLRDVGPSGGLIFYITGNTYYEAAPIDQSSSQSWSNIINSLVGTSSAIGTGQANTTAIIGQFGHVSSAAKLCDDLIIGAGAPTAITATSITPYTMIANWNSSIGAIGYKLDVSTNIGFTAFVTGFNNKDVGNVLTYSITGLEANITYYYRLRAYGIYGTSENSNIITTTTPLPTLTIRRLLRTWRLKIPRDKKNIGSSGIYDARIRNQNSIVEFTYGKNTRNTLGDKRIVINDISVVFMV